jgi:ABC-2 type transport system ATP-binding protein
MPEPAILASNVTRRYGNRLALDRLSLEVPEGAVFGLLGPNGSGKSTFIALVAAAEAPDSGELEVLTERPARPLLQRNGTVFQENTADPLMRVSEYLRFAGALFNVPRSELQARIPELLGRFGLGERAFDPVSQLSGGMRRRLEVARALLHRPELLLLDEPTTGVDAEERSVLWHALLGGERRPTVLLATNDLVEADAVCTRVAFLQAGRILAEGTPAELKAGLRRESIRIGWKQPAPAQIAQLASWPGVGDVDVVEDEGTIVVTADDASTLIPRLFELAPGAIHSVAVAPASLEDAYFQHVRRRSEVTAK